MEDEGDFEALRLRDIEARKFFDANFFSNLKVFFRHKCFPDLQFLWTQIFWDQIFFLNQNIFLTKKFQTQILDQTCRTKQTNSTKPKLPKEHNQNAKIKFIRGDLIMEKQENFGVFPK